jgi:hypothetical protein
VKASSPTLLGRDLDALAFASIAVFDPEGIFEHYRDQSEHRRTIQ